MGLSPELQKLHDSLTCITCNGAQHSHVKIVETDSLAKLKTVTLNATKGDWFSFSPDQGKGKSKKMSPLLSKGKKHGHHCSCDCVVLVLRDKRLTALYIDLKSGNPDGYAAQFKSTRQFMRYALGLLKEFHGLSLNLDDERYLILYAGKHTSLNKTTTVPPLKIGKSQPDKAYKREVFNEATLYLKEFLT